MIFTIERRGWEWEVRCERDGYIGAGYSPSFAIAVVDAWCNQVNGCSTWQQRRCFL